MSRTLIERVTCDKCGEVREFEKFENSVMRIRFEDLTHWLRDLGWYITGQLRTVDICPECAKRLVPRKGKHEDDNS